MGRVRSNKSKNKSSKAEEIRAGQSDEHLAQHQSSQPAASSKERQEQQSMPEEPAADMREPEKLSAQTLTPTAHGHEGTEYESVMHRRIAERAFLLFQESGYEHGNDWSHWFEAERQIKVLRV